MLRLSMPPPRCMWKARYSDGTQVPYSRTCQIIDCPFRGVVTAINSGDVQFLNGEAVVFVGDECVSYAEMAVTMDDLIRILEIEMNTNTISVLLGLIAESSTDEITAIEQVIHLIREKQDEESRSTRPTGGQ